MVSNIAGHHVPRSRGAGAGERWRDSRAFAYVAAIAYGFAGIVLPVVGWVIGVIMVATSPRWSARQKRWCATVPLILTLAAVAVTSLASALHSDTERFPMAESLPSAYDIAWFGIVVVLVISASIGVWLMHSARD
ncbi:hypothetical protein [Microbacterium sp. MPKO10]|uniref:hypothetical protein n=1 Tax=Microbacterium sp. MPKO10 TaxID=2989818 RepID=UPI0022356DD0|nr:hypothetical protein [Microbacterium sp. MPKO10]MCW4459438.1 hypothetical protein [Microbacterium sp. MPKO10]